MLRSDELARRRAGPRGGAGPGPRRSSRGASVTESAPLVAMNPGPKKLFWVPRIFSMESRAARLSVGSQLDAISATE